MFQNLTLLDSAQNMLQNDHYTSHHTSKTLLHYPVQDAQLSQRDRAAVCVIVFAKSRRLELGDNILRTLQVYLQPL